MDAFVVGAAVDVPAANAQSGASKRVWRAKECENLILGEESIG